jgi:hypothetical protein
VSWKPTGILLAAAAVVFAFVWLVDRPIRLQREREASRAVLFGFDPRTITGVEIKPRGASEIQAARVDSSSQVWQMAQPLNYPAYAAPIISLLNSLALLEWQQRIPALELKNQSNAQEKFGFTQPLFEISLQGSAAPRDILIGQPSALGDQVFLEVVGNPDVYLVGADFLKMIPADKDQWRDLGILNPSQFSFTAIQVRSPGKGFDLQLDTTNHLWSMTKPVTARADTADIAQWLKDLQQLSVRQFVSDDPKLDLEPYGLQVSPQTPDLEIAFLRGTNVAADLQVGDSPTNLPALAYARRLDPSNVLVIDRAPLRPWQAGYTNFLDYHFISGSLERIGMITVEGDDDHPFSVQKQSDGHWEVHEETTYPADAGLMHDWLAAFTNVQTHIEKTVATDFEQYGLAPHPALRYTLLAGPNSSNVIAQIDFGANAGRIFERRPDESFVNLIAPDDYASLPRLAWQLRDRHIWSFDSSNVVSLTVHQQGATRKYLRDPDGGWTFAPGYHAPPEVNWPALEEGVFRMGKLQANYWSGVGDAHWKEFGFDTADFNLTFEIRRGDKTELDSIDFGGRSPLSYPYASIVRDGRRLFFEFPVDLYDNFVDHDMTIPAALRYHRS